MNSPTTAYPTYIGASCGRTDLCQPQTNRQGRRLPLRKAKSVKSSKGFVTASPPERSDILCLQSQCQQ